MSTPFAPSVAVPVTDLSDEALVERVRRGDRALFEVLMRRNNTRVYRSLRGMLRNEAEIEDVMQQAYLQAYTRLSQFEGTARFSTWLVRIALNEALQRMRQARRLALVEDTLGSEEETAMEAVPRAAPSPEQAANAHEVVRLVERTLDSLPPDYRVVLMLRQVEGLTTAEAAAALGISDDAVKQRLHRAKAMLRDELEARTGEHLSEVFPFAAPRCDRVVQGVWSALGDAAPG